MGYQRVGRILASAWSPWLGDFGRCQSLCYHLVGEIVQLLCVQLVEVPSHLTLLIPLTESEEVEYFQF